MSLSVDKLALIRAAMQQKGIDVYIIPYSDPHLEEHIPDHWNIIQWLTGFTGSAATVIITQSFAGLWTDSRYFLQAERQLHGSGFEPVRPGSFNKSDHTEWIAEKIQSGSMIGFDGRIMSIARFRKIKNFLEGKEMIFDNDCDLPGMIWKDRPPMPGSKAWDHPLEFAGRDRAGKIADVREEMKKMDADFHLLTSLDDIMWLMNIRGNDVPYSPLLTSYAVVGHEQILLFADNNKIPAAIKSEFDKLGIVILPYEETAGMISSLTEGSSILISPETTSVTIYNSIPKRFRIIENVSIPAQLKAVKNKTEVMNIGKVMIADGVALTKFFYSLENNFGLVPVTELSLSAKLLELRSLHKNFLGLAFPSIIAFKEHAALPHYSPSKETDSIIEGTGILLIDSGGQYMGGTTDITRTVSLGPATAQQKKDFTLVLKGHIRLARAKFPAGTKGCQLDILARESLWERGLNYGHGTGHGVGFCLNVHEGPQNISPADVRIAIQPGMLISNEPAIYRESEYGIRTENLVICYDDEETEFGHFLKFDTVSLCFIDKELIDKTLLVDDEIDWLNSYHSEVYANLYPQLTAAEKKWLKEKTEPL